MHEYGWKLDYVLSLTKSQMIYFSKKASNRTMRYRKFLAKIHGAEMKTNGLDTDGAVPIENIMNKGGGTL